MDRHRVFRAERGVVPHQLIDLAGGEHPAGVLHQQEKDVVLDGGEADPLPVHGDRFGPVIQRDAAVGEQGGIGLPAALLAAQAGVAPELALDPCDDLDGIEGLGDVVVRPDVQPQDFVAVLALGGEQDDGHVAALPQLGRGADAVQAGHHHVQQDQIHRLALRQAQALQPVVGLHGGIALAGQVDVQGRDDVLVVVADQDGIHTVTSDCKVSIADEA